jgi:hypothetical protein
MAKYSVLIFMFLLFLSNNLYSQNYSVTGSVFDPNKKDPLISATVQVYSGDKLFGGVITDIKGNFTIKEVPRGNYSLTISYVGYKTYKTNFRVIDRLVDLKIITLTPDDVKLGEIVSEGIAQPVVQNADTTEYHSSAYKVNKDANADELVAKLPGVTVEDGKVTAQGEEVRTVLVDGRQFFGNDPNAVLRNIPAEIIERIQIFDKQSEQSEFTGFNDGNATRTINVVTRVDSRNGIFGRLNAGYGTDQKYSASGSMNYFNNEQRLTVVAQTNNINEQNFSSDDLMGVMAGSAGGGRGGNMRSAGGMGGNRQGGPMGGNRDAANFMVNARDGLTKTNAFGLNYSDNWARSIEFSGSYFFNMTNNEADSKINRFYYPASGIDDQQYDEVSNSESKNINHRINFRMVYTIDTMNSIILSPRFTYQGNDGSNIMLGRTFSSERDINFSNSSTSSNLSAINSSTDLLYRHRFQTTGRTISSRINFQLNNNYGDNKQFSEDIFYDQLAFADITDQIGNLDKNGTGILFNLSYTEPVGDRGQVQVMGEVNNSKDESETKIFSKNIFENNYSDLDTSLTNKYVRNYNTRALSTGYNYRGEKFSLNGGFRYNYAELSNDQEFPRSFNLTKNFNSFLPYFNFRYGERRVSEISLDYRATNNAPSVTQLQNVLNNSNTLQLSIGNPDLSQDFRHNLSLRYTLTDPKTYSTLFLIFSGTLTQNYIASERIIASRDTVINGIALNPGVQLSMPINLDGYKNFRSIVTYSTPVRWLLCNFNINFSYNTSITPVKQNGVLGSTNSSNYALGIVVTSNIDPSIDFSVSSTNTYNNIKSDFNNSNRQNYFSQRTRVRLYYDFYNGSIVQTDFNYRYDGGMSQNENPNSYTWNISLRQKLFKDNSGELKLSVNDVLNKTSNINRNVTEAYYEDVNTNVLGRFYMLSFTYSLRSFGIRN